jgi:hypothetical protein
MLKWFYFKEEKRFLKLVFSKRGFHASGGGEGVNGAKGVVWMI